MNYPVQRPKPNGPSCKAGHTGARYRSGNCVECKRRYRLSEFGKESKARAARKYRLSDLGRKQRLLGNARRRARIKGMPCTITVDDISIPSHCPVLGMPLAFGTAGLEALSSPSLDRVDNSQGYVRGNVRVVSLRWNKMKSNLTLSQLNELPRRIRSYLTIAGSSNEKCVVRSG